MPGIISYMLVKIRVTKFPEGLVGIERTVLNAEYQMRFARDLLLVSDSDIKQL